MSYKVNGIEFLLEPTSGGWVGRHAIGRDGVGHSVYPGVREYEMSWQLSFPSGTWQLQDFFEQVYVTGTAVVDLPRYNYPTYEFFSYSGCVINEPEFRTFFAENQTNVTLVISNIRT